MYTHGAMLLRYEILIPTYNRSRYLERNLELLLAERAALPDETRLTIRVSDNASTDSTGKMLEKFASCPEVIVHRQAANQGLEANAVAVLAASSADVIIFLGDDDYLPEGYLADVMRRFDADDQLGCIIPGFTSYGPDGIAVYSRGKGQPDEAFLPGLYSVLRVSQYGHQLSGLALRRAGLLDAYLANERLRNIYLFIFFLAFCLERSRGLFLPSWQVSVTAGESKDWKYDECGLATEILKNYALLYPRSALRRIAASQAFLLQQRWRLRGEGGLRSTARSFRRAMNSELDAVIKATLPGTYVVVAGEAVARRLAAAILSMYRDFGRTHEDGLPRDSGGGPGSVL